MSPLNEEDAPLTSINSQPLASSRDPRVHLQVWPKQTFTREGYRTMCLERARQFSGAVIFNALDGVVGDSSYSEALVEDDEDGTRVIVACNYNHHGEEEDPNTPATCEQLMIADLCEGTRARIWHGLEGESVTQMYQDWENGEVRTEGVTEINDVNDCDPDCCVSYWYRLHRADIARWRVSNSPEDLRRWQRVESLVRLEGLVDRKAGICKMDLSNPLVAEMAWMFEPYFSHRNGVPVMCAEEFKAVIVEVCTRIDRYIEGDAESRELDLRSTPVSGVICGEEVAFVDESQSGPYAKVLEVNRGKRIVVSVREAQIPDPERSPPLGVDGLPKKDAQAPLVHRYFYTIVMADYQDVPLARQPVTFDFRRIYATLNRGLRPGSKTRWSGRWNAGGSPRDEGTTQTPQEVANVIRSLRVFVTETQVGDHDDDLSHIFVEEGVRARRNPPYMH